ncbi:hypothetical protein M5K25_021472 [Dendrobium thyrsiflorum]|uniref:Uncharacterized protein n=1 Tax=Dendrobium thyrsiflorum TaxID=117978 RepID=A0ABD0UCG9_DENTH
MVRMRTKHLLLNRAARRDESNADNCLSDLCHPPTMIFPTSIAGRLRSFQPPSPTTVLPTSAARQWSFRPSSPADHGYGKKRNNGASFDHSRVEASHQATATPTKETLDPKREWRAEYSLPLPGYPSATKPPISAKKATTFGSLEFETEIYEIHWFGGFTGFGRRSMRKGERYLHSKRAPLVASDQKML